MNKKNLELEANGLIVFIISMAAGLINYLYQIIMGNMMAPQDYGMLNTLLSLSMVMSVPAGSIGVIALKYTSHFAATEQNDKIALVFKRLGSIALLCVVLTVAVGAICEPFIKNVLKIDNGTYVIIALMVAGLEYLLYTGRGILQGLKKFVAYSMTSIVGAAGKIVIGVLLLLLGMGLYGVTFSLVIASLITFAFSFVCLRKHILPLYRGSGKLEDINLGSYFKYIFWTQIFLLLMTNGDVLFIKMFTDNHTVGIYSSVSVLCKISYYFANSIACTLMPIVAQEFAKGNRTFNLFIRSVIYGLTISVLCAVVINIFGEFAIRLLFGSEYLSATALFIPVSAFIIALNLVTILINYQTAVNDMKLLTITLLIGLAVAVGLVMCFHSTVAQIMYSLAASMFGIFIINFIAVFAKNNS